MRYSEICEAIHTQFLYHGTSCSGAVEIIRTNSFMADDDIDGLGAGLSMTRDFEKAKHFADVKSHEAALEGELPTNAIANYLANYRAHASRFEHPPFIAEFLTTAPNCWGTGGVILVLDRTLMRKPKSIDWKKNPTADEDEEEERLVVRGGGEKILGARKMIHEIIPLNPQRFEKFCKFLLELDPKYNASVAFMKSKVSS